jgi:cell division protein FtsB
MRENEHPVNGAREFVQKMVQWRRLVATAAFGVIAAGLFAHVLAGDNGWVAYRQKKVEYQKLQQELQHMNEENQRLDSKIKALKSDPKAIEKEAREQLRYAKPGEVIYILPEPQGPRPAQPPQSPESARR